jgi:hypothetical protein
LAAVNKKPEAVLQVLAEMAQSDPSFSAPFIEQFCGRLQGQSPALATVQSWVEHHLADQGSTREQLQCADNQTQAVNQLSISNSIGSLRFLNAMDWRQFVETMSVVERVLRRDPAAVYGGMDFVTRDRYWREKGLDVDLVILNEGGYRQVLQERILGLIAAGTEAQRLDQSGGIFRRHSEQLSEEDRVLLQTVARVTPQEEFMNRVQAPVPRLLWGDGVAATTWSRHGNMRRADRFLTRRRSATRRACRPRCRGGRGPRRAVVCLNGQGRFQPALGPAVASPQSTGWGWVRVPGSWRAGGVFEGVTRASGPSWDGFDGENPAAWYERDLTVPAAWSGRAIFLDLQRVSTDAAVFIDGQEIGRLAWPGGEVDLTAAVRPGQTHRLRLKVVAVADAAEVTRFMGTGEGQVVKEAAVVGVRGVIGDARLSSRPSGAHLTHCGIRTSVREHTLELSATGPGLDNAWLETFGFREFRLDGKRFLLNEREIRLRPTHANAEGLVNGNRALMASFFAGLRANGFNCVELWPWDRDERGRPEFDDLWCAEADLTLIEGCLRRGGHVLLMAQDPEWLRERLGLRVARQLPRRGFPTLTDHPALGGLDAEALRDWSGSSRLVDPTDASLVGAHPWRCPPYGWRWGSRHAISSAAIEVPHRAGWRPLIACDADERGMQEVAVSKEWESYGGPWAGADGEAVFRRTIDIPPTWAGKDLRLSLGAVDDFDTTFFDGERVGATDVTVANYWSAPRLYTVPGRLVTPGRHVIAVRVFDHFGTGAWPARPRRWP